MREVDEAQPETGGPFFIDPEFKSLIPPPTMEEYTGLEKSLTDEGCRDALVIWEGIVIDGHNRFEICQREGIPFRTLEKSFGDRAAVKDWIIRNQFNRRNLSPYQRAELALKLEGLFREKAEKNRGARTDISPTLAESIKPVDTREEISKMAGLSHENKDYKTYSLPIAFADLHKAVSVARIIII